MTTYMKPENGRRWHIPSGTYRMDLTYPAPRMVCGITVDEVLSETTDVKPEPRDICGKCWERGEQ